MRADDDFVENVVSDDDGQIELQTLNGAEDDQIELNPLVSEGEDPVEVLTPCSQAHKAHQGEFGEPGTASPKQVAINIFISFVGAGMLGMPYAFSRSGWLLGALSLSAVSIGNVYAMLLLVSCKKRLEAEGHKNIDGYGDIGRIVGGTFGEKFVNICLVISQVGFGTAYIIFIAANLHNIAQINRAYVCFGCIPLLAILVQAKEMRTLSPFSLIADVANIVGLSAVLLQDFEWWEYHHESIVAFNFSNLLYVTGVSIYSLEGVGLIIPLEASCADRKGFPSILKKVICGITSLMIVFGCCGYIAFGSQTEAPITLNLQGGWATFVKLALCLALYLTYPIMLFPVNEVMENMFLHVDSKPSRVFRVGVVFLTALVAYAVPDFGKFLSLVGSSICTILGFIIPCYFHLRVFDRHELRSWELMLDIFLIFFGVVFGALGTYDSFRNLFIN